MIYYNKPFFHENCLEYIKDTSTHQAGDGKYSKLIYSILKERYNFNHTLLTSSCTHSLEMMAMILKIKKGDEIIIPSYTFVSTANAFVKFGAKVILIDSCSNHPNMDIELISSFITKKTRAVCIVHYAGTSCNMERLLEICSFYNILLLEDAAQAINSYYNGKPLGSFGVMSAFSFHETKNINCGEGGLLVINDPQYILGAEIIREKGTNRTQFIQNKASKYEWVGVGSSYLMSDINAAYLYYQFIHIDEILEHRKILWMTYEKYLKQENSPGNYHIYYILCHCPIKMKEFLLENNIQSSTHYIPLHLSQYYRSNYALQSLPNSEFFNNHLLRLPLHNELTVENVTKICNFVLQSRQLIII